jgi:hypothetical protein
MMKVEKHVVDKWQSVVDTMAELMDVPAGLIMRISGPDIEVFISSKTAENPYHVGAKEYLADSGLYCETVINTKEKLLVPDATIDENWKDNPDVKLGMISYLGYPITLPSGDVFGTICVLDKKENHYSEIYERLLLQFKELIENHLVSIGQNQELLERIAEIQTLQGILPICCYCKKIRDDKGYWQAVDSYFREHSEVEFSHGFCIDCVKEKFPELYEKNKEKYDALVLRS